MAFTNPPLNSIKATYQGIPCLEADVVRTPGADPDFGHVLIPRRALEQIRLKTEPKLYGPVRGGGSTTSRDTDSDVEELPAPTLTQPLRIKGDLIYSGSTGEQVVYKDMYLREDGVEQVHQAIEGENALVRLSLTDLRFFWQQRGELWGYYNVKRADGDVRPQVPQARSAIHAQGSVRDRPQGASW